MSGTVAKLKERAEAARRHADRMDKMLELAQQIGEEGLAELVSLIADDAPTANGNGHTTKSTPEQPRGRDAVRRIVRERPGIWTYAELQSEMKRRGWFTSRTGLEAAAKRLCDVNGEGKRLGKGQYVFPANHGEEVADESDPSDGAMIPFET